MSNADTLAPLHGEPQIPSLTPKSSGSNLKVVAAAGLLLLSLVAVLGFAASRYFGGPKEGQPTPTPEVASATAPRVTFKEPPAVVANAAPPEQDPAVRAIALASPVRVPSIEAQTPDQAQAIAVRSNGNAPARAPVPVGDESTIHIGW